MAYKKIPKFDELPELLTLTEASLVLSYNEGYLRKKAKDKEFPAFQLFDNSGNRCEWRVFKSDMMEWLKDRKGAYIKKNA